MQRQGQGQQQQTYDPWAASMAKFATLGMADDFLAADSARKKERDAGDGGDAGARETAFDDYDVAERATLFPPPAGDDQEPDPQDGRGGGRGGDRSGEAVRSRRSGSGYGSGPAPPACRPTGAPRPPPPSSSRRPRRRVRLSVPVPAPLGLNLGSSSSCSSRNRSYSSSRSRSGPGCLLPTRKRSGEEDRRRRWGVLRDGIPRDSSPPGWQPA